MIWPQRALASEDGLLEKFARAGEVALFGEDPTQVNQGPQRVAVRRTEDDLATAVIGDEFAQLVDAVRRVTTSYEVGATPAPADVKLIMAHSTGARAKFMAWQSALKTKKKEASRFKDRIDEVREALSKLLLRGTEKPEDTAQTTIPGIDTEPPEPQGWPAARRKPAATRQAQAHRTPAPHPAPPPPADRAS